MGSRVLSVVLLLIYCALLDAWQSDLWDDKRVQDSGRRPFHSHSKRHMLPNEHSIRRRMPPSTPRSREYRKKPTGHLKPLDEDDIDDEVMSVAIGPPPMRPKYEKAKKTIINQNNNGNNISNSQVQPSAVNLVRDVLSQISKDFLGHQVSEDFVFGQYVGNAMKNLTNELRLSMQHEILDLIMKYQKKNRGDKVEQKDNKLDFKFEKKGNETDEWPDFSNLAKIMG